MKVSNSDIHSHLVQVYGENALSLKRVEYWTHQFKIGRNTIENAAQSGKPKEISYRFLIQNLIEDYPYISGRQFVQITSVLLILRNDFWFKYKHLRWIPHTLTSQLKKNRVTQ